jgi:excisionase family DNA binding protein
MSPYLTLEEAARYLRVSPTTFRKHVYPKIERHMIGRKPMFKPSELDAYMTEHAHTPTVAKQRRRKARALVRSSKQIADIAAELEGAA